jgi:hypothetical protein
MCDGGSDHEATGFVGSDHIDVLVPEVISQLRDALPERMLVLEKRRDVPEDDSLELRNPPYLRFQIYRVVTPL